MQRDMSDQIAPPVLFEVKARRPLALIRREQLPPTVEIDARIIEPHRPDMDCTVKRRKFGRRGRPGGHNKKFTAKTPRTQRNRIRSLSRKACPEQSRRSAKTLSDGQGPSSRVEAGEPEAISPGVYPELGEGVEMTFRSRLCALAPLREIMRFLFCVLCGQNSDLRALRGGLRTNFPAAFLRPGLFSPTRCAAAIRG